MYINGIYINPTNIESIEFKETSKLAEYNVYKLGDTYYSINEKDNLLRDLTTGYAESTSSHLLSSYEKRKLDDRLRKIKMNGVIKRFKKDSGFLTVYIKTVSGYVHKFKLFEHIYKEDFVDGEIKVIKHIEKEYSNFPTIKEVHKLLIDTYSSTNKKVEL